MSQSFGQRMGGFFLTSKKILCNLCVYILITGLCIQVHDGDTISVKENGRTIRIRLACMDAPEMGQTFGAQAKAILADLCYKQIVTVQPLEKDRYGRLVARVYLEDGRDVGAIMVAEGYAWYYGFYHKDSVLAGLQSQARAQRLGLWQQEKPMPPWRWRRLNPRQ